jgi:uncharacterized protein YbjQ (UPF0145 family)
MKRKFLLIAAATVLMSGCATERAIDPDYQPSGPDIAELAQRAKSIKVYRKDPAEYRELGIISASTEGSTLVTDQEKTEGVLWSLKLRAAELGGNGVILLDIDTVHSTSGSMLKGSGWLTTSYHRTAQGVAIITPIPMSPPN